LIIEDDTLVGMGLKAQLQKLGHVVVGQATNRAEAAELFGSETPDLALVDIRLNGDDGIEVARDLQKVRPCPTVIVSAYSDRALIERASVAGAFGYLIKPVSEQLLAAQIAVAMGRFAEAQQLRAEKQKLADDLATRRLMDRAKAVLIKRAGLSEDDAHRRLQQESQKRRIAMPDLCRKVIESNELLE
jgi:response regulator NasT